MTRLTAEELGQDVNHALELVVVDRERVVVRRNGKDVAALVPIEDMDLIERLEDEEDIEDARAILNEIEKEGTISLEDIKKEFGIK